MCVWFKVWGEGLSKGYAGQQSNFLLNPNGLSLSGITFAVVGKIRLFQTPKNIVHCSTIALALHKSALVHY